MATEKSQKLHALADTLINALESKVMLDRGGPHEGSSLQFHGIEHLDDRYVVKGHKQGIEALTEALKNFEIEHLPAEKSWLGGGEVTIPFTDEDLGQKLAAATTDIEAKTAQRLQVRGRPSASIEID